MPGESRINFNAYDHLVTQQPTKTRFFVLAFYGCGAEVFHNCCEGARKLPSDRNARIL